nr:MAG TPA: hypothetical protein [Caudoviricetes sp.]
MLIKSAAGLAWCGADWWWGPLPPGLPELWLYGGTKVVTR